MIPCCCTADCLIQEDTFDGTLASFTQIGTVSIGGGVATLQVGEGLVSTSTPTNSTDPVHLAVVASTADSAATLRLAVARADSSNYLFGDYAISAGVGTIRLGVRLAGVETWLTDALEVTDTTNLGNETTFTLCWVPGETQSSDSYDVQGSPRVFSDNNAWVDPDNSLGPSDSLYADSTVESGAVGEEWKDYGFAIPAGSTIDGITVAIIAYGTENSGVLTPTIDLVQLLDKDGTQVGDDKAAGESLPNTPGTTSYGGAADDWNAGLTWEDINDEDFGVAVSFTTDSNGIFVDAVIITVYYTTPDRHPGRLTFSRENVNTATYDCIIEYSAQAPGSGSNAMVLSGVGTWDIETFTYSYNNSGTHAGCPSCPCTTPEAEPCVCCDEGPPQASLLLDFGVGGWTDDQCGTYCSEIAGEYAVSTIAGCLWLYSETTITAGSGCNKVVYLALGGNSPATCIWRAEVNVSEFTAGTATETMLAVYESATITDCQTFPVTLNKVYDGAVGIPSPTCTGALPATITLDEP